MLRSGIPGKFPEIWAKNADVGTITNPIPTTTGTPGRASLDKGWTGINATPIASGGIPPFEQDFNGFLQWLSQWSNWQQAGATVQYDGTFSTNFGGYPAGAILASSAIAGLLWQSTADNNTTDPDGGSPANWIPIALPYSSARAGGGGAACYCYAGNPNGHVAGTAGVAGTSPPDLCWDSTDNTLYVCTTSGNAAAAVWQQANPASHAFVQLGSTTGSANAQVAATLDHAGFVNAAGNATLINPGFTNSGAATLSVGGQPALPVVKATAGGTLVALTGSELRNLRPQWVFCNGTQHVLVGIPASGTLVAGAVCTSGLLSVTNALTTTAHGLGATPTLLAMNLLCVSADATPGYSPNDIVPMGSFVIDAGGSSIVPPTVSSYANSVNAYIQITNPSSAGGIFVPVKGSSTNNTNITLSKWRLQVTPFGLA